MSPRKLRQLLIQCAQNEDPSVNADVQTIQIANFIRQIECIRLVEDREFLCRRDIDGPTGYIGSGSSMMLVIEEILIAVSARCLGMQMTWFSAA